MYTCLYVCIKNITCILIFFDNINGCKLLIVSNTNLYEATTNNIIIELLNENDNITNESMHENDILNVSIHIYYIIY